MTVEERRRRRFTESFRKTQVSLIESGKTSISEVSRLYEVKQSSVRRWLSKYGKKDLPGPIIVSDPSDIVRLKELEKENKKLKELVANQQLSLVYQEGILALAKERLGDDFEKK